MKGNERRLEQELVDAGIGVTACCFWLMGYHQVVQALWPMLGEVQLKSDHVLSSHPKKCTF